MNSHPRRRFLRSRVLASFTAFLAFVSASFAQNTATGTIEGRVFNPVTKEYLRNAEVRIQGTTNFAITGNDGHYRMANVPTGSVTLSVNYTGYQPAVAAVVVAAGQVVSRDFDLQSSTAATEGVVALDKFTVSSRREGTAKAIMEQRAALTVKNVIASDTFGDMMEGNIAEVLQYLPGMEVVYCGGDPISFSGRGMAAKYGALTIDGVRTPPTAGGRQPSLVQYSANASDTIEFSKTNSADMDADAPGGSINLKSKSAFQRRGRSFSYQAYGLVNSYQLHLGKSDGPNDGQTYKTLPGLTLDYSDVYMDGKLGIVANFSEANGSNEQAVFSYAYDAIPTVANPTPVVMTTMAYTNGPKVNRRQGGGLSVEYKLTPKITLALRGQMNNEDARIYNRQFQLVTNRANLAPGSNDLVMITTPTATNVTRFAMAGGTTNRTTSNHSFAPAITYEGKQLSFDATFSYSRAGRYQRNGRLDSNSASFGSVNMQLFGVGWVASRDAIDATRIDFRQTAGPDLYTLANWRATSVANNMTRAPLEPTSKTLLGQFNAKYTPEWTVPTFFQFGAKTFVNKFFQLSRAYSWTYVGPENNRLTTELPVSVYRFFDWTGTNLFSDRKVEYPDRQALGSLLQEHPEYFVQNPADATSNANLFGNRAAREYIDAVYAMGNTRLGRVTLQGGVRFEATETRATVIERSVARERMGEHDDVFFSGAARYRFTDKLMALASFSQSILRADLNSKSAVATINETAMTGTIPNPDLKPEYGNNYSVRLEYYFEPVGVLSAGVFRMDMKDYQFASSGVPAEDIGLGNEYAGFLFSTQGNADSFRVEGYELEYSQQLTFLPGILRGLGVFANYARTVYSNPELAFGRSPETMSGGVSYRYKRLNTALRWSATPDTLLTATTYRSARHMLGSSVSYQLTQRTSLFLTGRNMANAPIETYRRDLVGYLAGRNKYGSNWTFGIKGTY